MGLMLQNGNSLSGSARHVATHFFLPRQRRWKKFWPDLYRCRVYYIFIVFVRRGSKKAPQNLELGAFFAERCKSVTIESIYMKFVCLFIHSVHGYCSGTEIKYFGRGLEQQYKNSMPSEQNCISP